MPIKKYFVFHDDLDSYVLAHDVSLTPGGELGFIRDDKLVACYQRGAWSYFKLIDDTQDDDNG